MNTAGRMAVYRSIGLALIMGSFANSVEMHWGWKLALVVGFLVFNTMDVGFLLGVHTDAKARGE